MRKLKDILVNLLLIILGPLFLCLVIEVGLRVHHALSEGNAGPLEEQLVRSEKATPVQDVGTAAIGGLIKSSRFSEVVYELKPNISGNFQGKPFRFNSLGLRDKEYEINKPPGTVRIVGIGDSVMFGWGVEEEECYLSIIEKKIADEYKLPKVEVINFAVPGYNTSMEVANFEHKVLPFSPDLVILHFVDNDFDVPLFMQQPKDVFSLQKSFFLDFFRERLAGLESHDLLRGSLKNIESEFRSKVLDQYKNTVGESGFRLALKKLSILTSSRSVPVIVVVGGVQGRMKRIVKREVALRGFHLLEVKPFVDNYMKSLPVEDSRAMRQKLLQLSPQDNHPNKLGHSIYAEAIFDKIKSVGQKNLLAKSGAGSCPSL